MTRTLRGAWSRRRALVPLLLLTVIVVAGTVAVLAVAEAADTSSALAAPLLLLGLVAVPATARELALARRGELALARLRGVQGGQLSALASVEPLVVLVLGGVAGLLLGGLAGRAALAVLAPSVPTDRPGTRALLAGVAIVVVGLVAVVAGMGRTLGEPLAEQVRSAQRPRAAGPVALALGVLVVVAAVVATYRASVAGSDPDLLVLAAPALVGLSAGLLAAAALQAVARALVGPTRRRGLAGYLAVRRLARTADVAGPLRLVVAAATVATVALTGAAQVSSWADQTARLRAGGPQQVGVADGSADTALRLSRELDPDGEHLMAAVLVPGAGSVPARCAFLDLARYDAVLGDFYADTPVAAAVPAMHDLIEVSGRPGGGELTVGVSGVSSRQGGSIRVLVTVGFAGGPAVLLGAMSVPRDGSRVEQTVPLTDLCASECTITSVEVRREGSSRLPVVLDRLELDGTDALDQEWAGAPTGAGGGVQQVDGGLLAPWSSTASSAETAPTGDLPVIATASAGWDGEPTAESPGGDDRDAVLVGRADALPLVEADGLLLDLPTAQAGAAPTVPIAEVGVVAAADTPPDLLAELEDRAGSRARSLGEVTEATVLRTGATQAGVYVVMAGACLLIALLALVTAFARQQEAWRRDLAALRVLGVPRPGLLGAARIEVALLAVTATLGSLAGGLVGVRLLLSHLALVRLPEHAVALRTGVEAGPAVAGGLAAALLVAVAVGRSRSVAARDSRPAILREGAER